MTNSKNFKAAQLREMVANSDRTKKEILANTSRSKATFHGLFTEENEHNIRLDDILEIASFTGQDPREYFPQIDEKLKVFNEPPAPYENEDNAYYMDLIRSISSDDVDPDKLQHVQEEVRKLLRENKDYKRKLKDYFDKLKTAL